MQTSPRSIRATHAALMPASYRANRTVAAYRDAVEYQARFHPVCRAAEYAAQDEAHPRFEALAHAYAQEAWERVEALGSVDTYEVVEAHRLHPVVPYGPHGECRCALCEAVGEARECDKEVRKTCWYYAPSRCECAACEPIPAPPALVEPSTPALRDLYGERGADW